MMVKADTDRLGITPDYPIRNKLIYVACVVGGAVILFFSSCNTLPVPAAEIEYTNGEIADAIFRAENSVKFPYGIKSINTHGDKEYARKICLNSIRNARNRWIKAGMPEDFIVYVGRRYSPPNINPNWVTLVKYFLLKGTVK